MPSRLRPTRRAQILAGWLTVVMILSGGILGAALHNWQ